MRWWSEGASDDEGNLLDTILSGLNLSQIITEPTHFRDNCRPSCIDLIITDQANPVLDCGVRPSLDTLCKHQITFCRTNFSMPPPPSCKRKVWQYNEAESVLITRAMDQFPWVKRLDQLKENPSQQVKLLNETILNIMSTFIPNKTITIKPSEPEWVNGEIKNKLRKQNRMYKKFKSHGFKEVDRISLDLHRKECNDAIEKSKNNYLLNLGNKMADKNIGQKAYWKIVNNLLNKCKAPRIPPVVIAGKFVSSCKEKASHFNNFFTSQCQPFINTSTLPDPHPRTNAKLDIFEVTNVNLKSILIVLKANKAHGHDDISVNMIKLCGESLILPLNLIFNNILRTAKFPK